MSIKKACRDKYSGLNPYQLWILVGIRLKYSLIPHKNNPRLLQWVSKDGEVKNGLEVHRNSVTSLVGLKMLSESPGDHYYLTPDSFEIVENVLESAKGKSNTLMFG